MLQLHSASASPCAHPQERQSFSSGSQVLVQPLPPISSSPCGTSSVLHTSELSPASRAGAGSEDATEESSLCKLSPSKEQREPGLGCLHPVLPGAVSSALDSAALLSTVLPHTADISPASSALSHELPFSVLRRLWISPVQVSLAGCSAVSQPGNSSRAPAPVPAPSAGSSPTVRRERSMLQLCLRAVPGPASAQL